MICMICMVCMIAPKDGFLQTMHSRKTMQIMHFMQGGGSRGFQDGPLYGMIDKNHTGRAVG